MCFCWDRLTSGAALRRGEWFECRSQRSGWPGSRGILLLRLYSVLFPTSDRRHAVCTPLALLVGYLLSSCPLRQPCDIAVALLLAAMLQGAAAEGERYAPEVTPLCEALLNSALSEAECMGGCVPLLALAVRNVRDSIIACLTHSANRLNKPADVAGTVYEQCAHSFRERLLCGHYQLPNGALAHGVASEKAKGHARRAPSSEGLPVWQLVGEASSSSHFRSDEFREAAFVTTLRLVEGQLAALQACAPASVPAAVLPLQRVLQLVCAHGRVSAASATTAAAALRALDTASAASVEQRKPLVCAALLKKVPRKLLNPKFELGFAKHKDFDPDRERADFKQYKRMAAKEQRGASSLCRSDICMQVALHRWSALATMSRPPCQLSDTSICAQRCDAR